ncbi:MAG: glycerol-3-phosphate dehydrogenase/oxidase [Microbacterium sp.]|uniref:glycerol-3-phosphate dehydrogenase/oxidase n=1 Tax=Microbacterium sp. TaxID=51671 RepID=UPI001AD077E6|nr:glycerol-3-phosphate dehydrogenase/oxidase [Microbacterium sp.]MBN9178469.1 glycerol-3-phosphate dehydrogenase/oxidase [Microbacterium sp.]
MSRVRGRTPGSTALYAARRIREIEEVADGAEIDVLVVGGGITGAGVALDAASRGLRTVLVERGDLASGTSAWSSKLVHGGLRYLASGQIGIAWESAAERHLLMTRIAPHLTRPLAQVLPLHGTDARSRGAFVGTGYALGDALRRGVGTPSALLPAPSRLSAAAVRNLAPAVRVDGLHSGIRGWDGQLVDDARLVVAVARTAAGFGARILTRVTAQRLRGDGAELRDAVTGATFTVRARAVVNATGVWAGSLTDAVALEPSRGTHLVVDSARLGGADVSITALVPGSRSRFVFSVPALHGRSYIGLTDVAADEITDDPRPDAAEIDFLLDTMSTVLADPLTRADVRGTFSGLRPLLRSVHAGGGETADLSRRHAVIEDDHGVLSVVGGKLTTYRRMAQDSVDAAVRRRALPTARPSLTADLPLVGAWPRERTGEIRAAARLVRRYGAEASFVAGLGERGSAAGPSAACGVTPAELEWGVRVEGALSVADLLHRRTRLGLVAADAEASADAARDAFARAGIDPVAE